jgi:6-phosphogluconate dehydrogenase
MTELSFAGIIGLGVMGRSLAMNMLDKGHSLSVYNRMAKGEEHLVSDFLEKNSQNKSLQGFTELGQFIQSLERPRKVLMMVKAGKPVDALVEAILPQLEPGDIIIDGGNSHFQDTLQRQQHCEAEGVYFVGMGVSGGEEGARFGPSMMPGGAKESYEVLAPLLESIAAKDAEGKPCCAYIGEGGAGHFVKMVHNGIEYAEMQLLAELYHYLRKSKTNEQIVDLFESWNNGSQTSFLLQCTIDILRHKSGDYFTLDLILDKAANKGTGSWSIKAAADVGVPATMIGAALFARYISSQKEERVFFSKKRKPNQVPSSTLQAETLESAYTIARLINHHQGFELVRAASETYSWNINLSELARIWTNGCIIRSELMQSCIDIFKKHRSMLHAEAFFNQIQEQEDALKMLIISGIASNLPLPCFQEANSYWQAITTANLPANLIQAQRDYFGAHTYQRIDRPDSEFFHTQWK